MRNPYEPLDLPKRKAERVIWDERRTVLYQLEEALIVARRNLYVTVAVIVCILVLGALIVNHFAPWYRPFVLSPSPPTMPPVALGPRFIPQPIAAGVAESDPASPEVSFSVVPGMSWDPQYIRYNARPVFPTKLSPQDEAWVAWLSGGNLKYESWQGMLNGTRSMYVFQPTYNQVLAAVNVEALKGAPANDLLAILGTEGNAGKTSYRCSDAGACGAMQNMPGFWGRHKPYPGADIQNDQDIMISSSNGLVENQAFAQKLSELEYEAHFRGKWKPGSAWNNHHEHAIATYRLSRLLAQSRWWFWQNWKPNQ
jgi:hypothetical protein